MMQRTTSRRSVDALACACSGSVAAGSRTPGASGDVPGRTARAWVGNDHPRHHVTGRNGRLARRTRGRQGRGVHELLRQPLHRNDCGSHRLPRGCSTTWLSRPVHSCVKEPQKSTELVVHFADVFETKGFSQHLTDASFSSILRVRENFLFDKSLRSA
jgi:hypothetical protein